MNVNRVSGTKNVSDIYKSNLRNIKSNKASSISKDKIEISDNARKMMELGDNSFDIERAKKVEIIRNQVQNGTYKPDVNKIASGIMKCFEEQK